MAEIAQKQPSIRKTDPNVLQNRASHPSSSIWVGASAGSGKTKVLTDRILRLMLPDQNNMNACEPHKILALTFTKSAASEMKIRIQKRLSDWAVSSEDALKNDLEKLLSHEPSMDQIQYAQKLFATVVDTPGGLKIMTIHSFCQSILGRFPLEADLNPSFKALEENQAFELLKKAQKNSFKKAKEEKGSPLSLAVHNLVLAQNEDQFSNLLQNLISERRQLKSILDNNFGIDGLYTALCLRLNVEAGLEEEEVLYQACKKENLNENDLWNACKDLAEGSEKSDQPRSIAIQNWLERSTTERQRYFDDYVSQFLTTQNTIRTSLATAKVKKNNPDIEHILNKEAERLFNVIQKIKVIRIVNLTRDLFMLGQNILEEYEILKNKQSALDFDDLIIRTLDLLEGRTKSMQGLEVSPWVRYKLDQGIDHILVDEAQDTNPEQWKIISALTDDFFDDQSEHDKNRTLFVVGDQKQSIFSFQRASPEKFNEMRQWFKEKISSNNKPFEEIDFNVSFRSVKSVLSLVDSIFSIPDIKKGLDTHDINHEAYRYTQAGLVELWPLFENPESSDIDPWTPPIDVIDSSSGASQMAEHIGQTIKSWIDKKEILASYNRPIQAGDIMILVGSRTAFIDQLVRALKTRNVPVNGVDRMVLNQQLVVQDLCAAAQFALLPEDDLTLASLLKSPFIGLNEEEIFDICYDRKGKSVWANLQEKLDDNITEWLHGLIHSSGQLRPYEFFSSLLNKKCPADISGIRAIKSRLGNEVLDPLNEFLNNALNFENDQIPTLQNFIQSQLYNDSQIKRQIEEGDNAVRIMTVHGAKGLQAPIVILPDTVKTSSSTKPKKILWPDRSGDKLPYFCPSSTDLPPPVDEAMQIVNEREEEEYRRLLYVALTRAEERLYIGGYKGSKKISDDCWYNYIKSGFENMPDIKTLEGGILQYTNPATDQPDRGPTKELKANNHTINEAPQWLFEPIKDEPFPPRPLTPSRPSESDMPALSPLQADNNYRFLRGNITHKLLQTLPDLPHDKRKQAAQNYVALPAHNIPQSVQDSIVKETLTILNDKKLKNIFGPNSMAEVPVTGLVDNKLVSGQIDRLLVTDEEVFILDYKTNRPPPDNLEDVPVIYKNQMQAYANIMKEIYKDKKIRTALIWTDGAKIMELPVSS